jgi:hypothetical protein
MKTCNTCKQEFAPDSFSKDASKKDKLSLYCRACRSISNRKFTQDNPGYHREYYLTNKLIVQERIEVWQNDHKGQMTAYRDKYYQANRDKINARRRARNAAKTVSISR